MSILIGVVFFYSCNHVTYNVEKIKEDIYAISVPKGFPPIVFPTDNKPTAARVALGKKLFYDPQLSKDGTISCASCHLPTYSFSDTVALSSGTTHSQTMRNSTQLANVCYQQKLFSEGGVSSLEIQVLAPSNESVEMNKSLALVAKEINGDFLYNKLFEEAYHSPPNAKFIAYAIANFERTLISGNSRFDQYYYQGKKDRLSLSEINGYKIFTGNCISCHSGFLFTDQQYYNIGLYEKDTDEGRARLTFNPNDLGKFKTPSLRNIALTAPYMHDGSMQTLTQVIDHYASGGKNNPLKNEQIKLIHLSKNDMKDLINFLHSLSDYSFVNNESYKAVE